MVDEKAPATNPLQLSIAMTGQQPVLTWGKAFCLHACLRACATQSSLNIKAFQNLGRGVFQFKHRALFSPRYTQPLKIDWMGSHQPIIPKESIQPHGTSLCLSGMLVAKSNWPYQILSWWHLFPSLILFYSPLLELWYLPIPTLIPLVATVQSTSSTRRLLTSSTHAKKYLQEMLSSYSIHGVLKLISISARPPRSQR